MIRMIRLVRLVALAGLAVPMSGCMTAAALYIAHEEREIARLNTPDPSEYAWASAPGVTVTGVVRLPTTQTRPIPGGVRNGPREILTCEGREVRLIPDTPRMRFILEREFDLRVEGGGAWQNGFFHHEWAWPSPSAEAVREATCGPDGAFTFEEVPEGAWLVMARIDPPAYDEGLSKADVVLKAVTIRSGGRPVHLDVQIGGNDLLYGPTQRKS